MTKRLEATLSEFAERLFAAEGAGDARVELYRGFLRGNVRAMLRFALTRSLALIETVGDADAVVARFVAESPARTHSSREMADRFAVFLPRAFPEIVAKRPDLVDLMTLERAELRAMLATDDPGRCLSADEVDALAARPLDELLATKVLRAPSASLLVVEHPVVLLHAVLRRGEPPPAPRVGVERIAVARGAPPVFRVDVSALDSEAALVLDGSAPDGSAPGAVRSLERVAAGWSASLPEGARGRDEAWKAGVFAAAVLAGLRSGFFRAE